MSVLGLNTPEVERKIAAYYSVKFGGKVWCQSSGRKWAIRGEKLPSELPIYSNGWSLLDTISTYQVRRILKRKQTVVDCVTAALKGWV